MAIVFAVLSPHPPIILPDVGSPEDRNQVKDTIENLKKLGEKLKEKNPDSIIISSPHPDWGFDVPLFFLAKDFKGKIEKVLIGSENPQFYFEQGKNLCQKLDRGPTSNQLGLIASGDLSHCLRADGPYGLHPQGPEFDKELIESLKEKDITNILRLADKYPEAGECGLRSFCFLLGVLEEAKISYQPEILSYQAPFGVGYLVANFKLS